MPNERFTDLPLPAGASFNDIICAVQGYISPANPGTSVQETLQEIYNLFQSNIILFNAGNPNTFVEGTTYQLCWDTVNHILYVCTSSGTAATAIWTKSIELTAGPGISILQSGNNITISSNDSGLVWSTETVGPIAMVGDHGYVSNGAALIDFALPATSSVGQIITICGFGAGGWTISQGVGQSIIVGNTTSSIGIGGSVSSLNQFDSITLNCIIQDFAWSVPSAPQGVLNII